MPPYAESQVRKDLTIFKERVLDPRVSDADADVIFSTVHTAKGLEWDVVQLADDLSCTPSALPMWLCDRMAPRLSMTSQPVPDLFASQAWDTSQPSTQPAEFLSASQAHREWQEAGFGFRRSAKEEDEVNIMCKLRAGCDMFAFAPCSRACLGCCRSHSCDCSSVFFLLLGADVALTRARLMLSVPRVSLFTKLVRTLAHIEENARRASQDPDYDMHDDADAFCGDLFSGPGDGVYSSRLRAQFAEAIINSSAVMRDVLARKGFDLPRVKIPPKRVVPASQSDTTKNTT
jgi:hypothetical protein